MFLLPARDKLSGSGLSQTPPKELKFLLQRMKVLVAEQTKDYMRNVVQKNA